LPILDRRDVDVAVAVPANADERDLVPIWREHGLLYLADVKAVQVDEAP